MAKRSTTETCCLTLPLVLEKWQSDRLEKRFEIARQIYNTLLNYELKKLRRLEQTEEYAALQAEVEGLRAKKERDEATLKKYKEQLDDMKLRCLEQTGEYAAIQAKRKSLHAERERDEAALKQRYGQLSNIRQDTGFWEKKFGFIYKDVEPFYKYFSKNSKNISSQVAKDILSRVTQAFEKYFYGNGKAVHFKKRGAMTSLQGGSGGRGGKEIIFRDSYVEWNKLKLPVKRSANNAYETEMLEKRVKYCRIVRKQGKNKPRWYVQLMLEGRPVLKCDKHTGEVLHPAGSGPVGIDLRPQTVAYAAQSEAALKELADGVQNIEREQRLIQRKLDRSRRATNPDNFAADGTVKQGVKLRWVKSKRYIALQRELAFLQRQQAETRKRQHNALANHLLSLGDRFYVNQTNWQALARRAKKTTVNEKTGRYRSKKRFGKYVANKAPAMLIEILTRKLQSQGLSGVVKIPADVGADRYNHLTGEYREKPSRQRWHTMPDGRRIQRNLYAAFLLQHMNETQDGFDAAALTRDYEGFVLLHDKAIEELQAAPNILSSMGIRRTAS